MSFLNPFKVNIEIKFHRKIIRLILGFSKELIVNNHNKVKFLKIIKNMIQ